MATFSNTYGAAALMASVADAIKRIENDDTDIHTITLVLNGQHGEFDLTIEATSGMTIGNDMEEVKWTGVAHRHGGIAGLAEVE